MAWGESFQRLHPDWEYRLHTSLEGFPYSCDSTSPFHGRLVALMASAQGFAQQSDILRLDLLLAYGGLYIDTDFQCLQSLEPLHSLPISLYCGMAHVGAVEVGNSLIACTAGHPLIRRALVDMQLEQTGAQPMQVIERTGPGHWTRVVCGWLLEEEERVGSEEQREAEVVVLPPSFFYPLPNHLRGLHEEAEERRLFHRAESLAVHQWACTWQATQGKVPEERIAADLLDGTQSTHVKPTFVMSRELAGASLPDALLHKISAFL